MTSIATHTPAIGPEGLRLSASQIDTFRACPRKWAYSRVLPGRSNAAAELGSEIHNLLEGWVLTGTSPADVLGASARAVACAMALIAHAPRPGACEVEGDFRLVRSAATYTGRRDYLYPPGTPRDKARTEAFGALPIVGDYKSTSDLKWAKSEDDLRTKDVPAALYAKSAMESYQVDRVGLEWPYVTTAKGKPIKTHIVRLIVVASDIEDTLRGIDDTAYEMRPYHGAAIDTIPRDVRSCDAFGGCPYLGPCAPSASERMSAAMTQSTLADRLRNLGGAPAARPSTPVTATEAPTSAIDPARTLAPGTPPASAPGGLAAKLAARAAAGAPAVEAQAAPVAATGGLAAKLAARNLAQAAAKPVVLEDATTRADEVRTIAESVRAPTPETVAEARAVAQELDAAYAAHGLPAGVTEAFDAVVRATEANPAALAASIECPSLRDQFAMAALTGILSRGTYESYDTTAIQAYALAEAMIVARSAI